MRIDELAIEDAPDAPLWGVDGPTVARWLELTPGTRVTVVKRSIKYGGEERARYPGVVLETILPTPWVVFETHWTYGRHVQAGLVFEIGDTLHEIFSPIHPYNAFAVYAPSGTFKAWYANITYPALVEQDDNGLAVVWRDLFIDLVAMPSGDVAVLDEDELEESHLAERDPELHARILAARDELLARFHARRPPFERLGRLETAANG